LVALLIENQWKVGHNSNL